MYKPSEDDFRDWRNGPVTEWVFEEIELMRRAYCQSVGEGATLDPKSTESTALRTAQTVGFIDGLTAILKLELKG